MDINKLMQQAQAMQKQMEEVGKQIDAMEFEGSASNGLVKVTVSGDDRLQSVWIDSSILNPDDQEMIQDLIMIAVNDAIDKADDYKKNRLGSMASAMGLPIK